MEASEQINTPCPLIGQLHCWWICLFLPWNHSTSPSNQPTPSTIIIQPMQSLFKPISDAKINATWRLFPLFMVKCLQEFVWFMVCLIYDFIRYWRRHIQVCLRTIGVSFLDYHLLYPLSAQCKVLSISWTIAVCCMGRPPPWRQY